ncbi:MAG: class I SAM-dependent methyltransferase [Sphingobacteriia bacterium]|nr:MAG: class I SAM-dependent methyltransferase [Sphingobacteriia bacterium]
MKPIIKKLAFKIYDILLLPFTWLYLPLVKKMRFHGVEHFPQHLRSFDALGVFPIQDHYYDPRFVYDKAFDAAANRGLQIDFKVPDQLELLKQLQFSEELKLFPAKGNVKLPHFFFENPSFSYGDAEMYYLFIRNLKPKRIVEIGSGFSTLIAVEAIKKNKFDAFHTELTCIEPYEFDWLETIPEVTVLRQKVEEVSLDFFAGLNAGDFLFIDSSHIIRPGNDVLFEYLNVLPVLKKGVIIHIHDIFSPNHYLEEWLVGMKRFWNEQYLLEAYLYYNESFSIKMSLNLLKNQHFNALKKVCIGLKNTTTPASFWLEKTTD